MENGRSTDHGRFILFAVFRAVKGRPASRWLRRWQNSSRPIGSISSSREVVATAVVGGGFRRLDPPSGPSNPGRRLSRSRRPFCIMAGRVWGSQACSRRARTSIVARTAGQRSADSPSFRPGIQGHPTWPQGRRLLLHRLGRASQVAAGPRPRGRAPARRLPGGSVGFHADRTYLRPPLVERVDHSLPCGLFFGQSGPDGYVAPAGAADRPRTRQDSTADSDQPVMSSHLAYGVALEPVQHDGQPFAGGGRASTARRTVSRVFVPDHAGHRFPAIWCPAGRAPAPGPRPPHLRRWSQQRLTTMRCSQVVNLAVG